MPAGQGVSATTGGVGVVFSDTTGGRFSAERFEVDRATFEASPPPGVPALGVVPLSDPVRYWQIEFDGEVSGPVTLVFPYDGVSLRVPESLLAISHYTGGEWVPLASAVDPGARTVTVERLSSFLLGSAAPCRDGLDGDGDGLVDLADPGCFSPDDPSERDASLVCDDGVDQDEDGRIDLGSDSGCASAFDPDEQSPALACDNGLDDDGDGFVDLGDPG